MRKSAHQNFEPGQRVCYARSFLQSCAIVSGPIAFARGTVQSVERDANVPDLVRVLWDGEKKARGSFCTNLWPVEKLHLEPV